MKRGKVGGGGQRGWREALQEDLIRLSEAKGPCTVTRKGRRGGLGRKKRKAMFRARTAPKGVENVRPGERREGEHKEGGTSK